MIFMQIQTSSKLNIFSSPDSFGALRFWSSFSLSLSRTFSMQLASLFYHIPILTNTKPTNFDFIYSKCSIYIYFVQFSLDFSENSFENPNDPISIPYFSKLIRFAFCWEFVYSVRFMFPWNGIRKGVLWVARNCMYECVSIAFICLFVWWFRFRCAWLCSL